MSKFSSGLQDPQDQAELIREKGRIDAKERKKKKRILKRDILTGVLSLSMIYALKLERDFTREEWAGILEELLRKDRREQREEDKKKAESVLRIGGSFP